MRENVWQRLSEVDSRGAMASDTVRLPSTRCRWFIIQKRSGGEGAAAPPQAQLLRDGAVQQRRREAGPVDWAMPLQLAAATVPGAAAAAQACGEERQDRLRLRPTGTRHGRGGGAAAGGRRGHRG